MNRTGRAALQQWRQVPPTQMRRTRDIGAVRPLFDTHPVRLAQLMLPGVEELLATYGSDRDESVPTGGTVDGSDGGQTATDQT